MEKKNPSQIAKEMVGQTMDVWFDHTLAKDNVNTAMKVEKKLLAGLLKDDLSAEKPKDKAQMVAYLSKTTDGTARLVQFGAGLADSRAEITLKDLLPLLTDEEFAIFNRALARLSTPEATGAGTKSELH